MDFFFKTWHVSDDFENYFSSVLSGDLCTLLENKESYVNFTYFCTNSRNGVMKRGLLLVLADLIDRLDNDL